MKSPIRTVFFLAAAIYPLPIRAQPSVSPSAPQLSFRYEPAPPATRSGSKAAVDSMTLVVRIELRDGWHINSEAPLDSFLVPTSLEASAPGMRFGKPVFPKPVMQKSEVMGGELSLFTGSFDVPVPAVRTAGASSGKPSPKAAAPTRVTLHYQACNNTMCLPPKSITVEQ